MPISNFIVYAIAGAVTDSAITSIFGMFVVFVSLIVLCALILLMWVVISNFILKSKQHLPTGYQPTQPMPPAPYSPPAPQPVKHIAENPVIYANSVHPVYTPTQSTVEPVPAQYTAPVENTAYNSEVCAPVSYSSATEQSAPTNAEPTPTAEPAVPPIVAAAPVTAAHTGSYSPLILSDIDETTAAIVMALVSYNTGIPLERLRFSSIRCIGVSDALSNPGTTIVTTLAARPIAVPVGSLTPKKLMPAQ